MTIKPLYDNVVLKPVKAEKTTKGGLLLPDTADKGKPEQGTVVAVGPGKLLGDGTLAKMSLKVGDKVVFKKYTPDEIDIDNETYLMLREDEILAVL
jgi:chaperonin GroES